MTKRRFARGSDIPQVAGRTPLEAALVGALEASARTTVTPRGRKRPVSETVILDFEDETVVVDIDDIDP